MTLGLATTPDNSTIPKQKPSGISYFSNRDHG